MTERHPSSQAFMDVLDEALRMHDRKQRDYGSDEDPFANVRAAVDFGLPGSLGACIRMQDKLRRLQAFYRKGELANESVEDAFMDLLVYAGIGLVLYREEADAVDKPVDPLNALKPYEQRETLAEHGGRIARSITNEHGADTSDTRTCVLCHGFLFNHGPNGECPA